MRSRPTRSKRPSVAMLATLVVGILLLVPVHRSDPVLGALALPFLDKALHVSLFGALAAVWSWALKSETESRRPWLLFLALLAYGAGLEVLQGLGTSRSPEPWDAVANALGAAIGLYLSRADQPARTPVDSR